jgi:hypothetical protein
LLSKNKRIDPSWSAFGEIWSKAQALSVLDITFEPDCLLQ